jgi:hypothetical protein
MVTVPGLPQVAGPAKVATQVAAGRWLGALTKNLVVRWGLVKAYDAYMGIGQNLLLSYLGDKHP